MVRRFSQKKKVDNFLDSRFQKNLAVSEILLKLVPVYGPSQFLIIWINFFEFCIGSVLHYDHISSFVWLQFLDVGSDKVIHQWVSQRILGGI